MHNPSKQKTPMPVQEPEVRSRNFDEVTLGYTEEQAVSEAQRCLNCRNKPCVGGCPVSINIPAFIHEVAERNFEGAYEILSRSTALPAVCGRVCPQESQCESRCVCGIKGEPVGIGRLERFVADWHSANATEKSVRPAPNGHKVAVIGSGPSGLSCAGELARKGYAVTVFEALHLAGGVLVYGIPEFRLPKRIVRREIENLQALGVDVETNVVIGKTLTIDELQKEYGFEAVFIGSGAGLPKFMGIPGESWKGVYSANEFLTRINLMNAYRPDSATPVQHGKKVAVVGGGNVAMDVARTALRSGARKVTVYARSRHISAIDDEVELTELDGAEIVCGKAICAIDDNGPVFETAIFDEDDNVVGYEDELDHAAADTVVIAASQVPKDKLVLTTGGLETDHRGLLSVDEQGMTTVSGVFAAGDVVNGPLTVVHAVAGAKLAVEGMVAYLGL